MNENEITIFSKITQLAKEHHAINLGQGFPTLLPDQNLLDYISNNISSINHQYTEMTGLYELRKSISDYYENTYSVSYNANDEITITNGATQAISTAISAIVQQDDEVIIIEPCFDVYLPNIKKQGGVIRTVTMICNQDCSWSIPWDEIRKVLSSKTKLIIINTPNNPTGTTIKADDIKELEWIVERYGTFILSDEVYENIVFDNKKHITLSSSEIIKNKLFLVSSFGKTLSITGWKIGYCCAPKKLSALFRLQHQFQVFTVCSLPQSAIAWYFNNHIEKIHGIAKVYEDKRNDLFSNLVNSPFKAYPCEGSFFTILDYSKISVVTDEQFVQDYIKKNRIAFIPFSAFMINKDKIQKKLVRMCFARTSEELTSFITNIVI